MPGNQLFHFDMVGARDVLGRFTRLTEGLADWQEDLAENIKRETLEKLRDECPVWSGDLKDALDGRVERAGREIRIQFFVKDVPSRVGDARLGPARYVDWVINGRGPVTPKNSPVLIYPTSPYDDSDLVVSTYSSPTDPNNFPLRAVEQMDGELEWEARKLTERVRSAWG